MRADFSSYEDSRSFPVPEQVPPDPLRRRTSADAESDDHRQKEDQKQRTEVTEVTWQQQRRTEEDVHCIVNGENDELVILLLTTWKRAWRGCGVDNFFFKKVVSAEGQVSQ